MNVVIAGGGVAGLEALLGLRAVAGERVGLILVAPEPDFSYRPLAVAEPFSVGSATRVPLTRVAAATGAELVADAVVGVDDGAREVLLESGATLAFDALLLATGARPVAGVEGGTTWWPGGDPDVYGGLLRDIEEGYSKRLAIVVPPGAVWPLPAYELALMTGWDVDSMGQRDVDIVVYTHEARPLQVFGEEAAAALADDLAEVRVRVECDMRVVAVDDGHLVAEPRERDGREPIDLRGQVVVALARAVGRPPGGLPTDEGGFVRIDRFGAVPGTEAVWAAGDCAAFPIKQGGLAAQQADVVAAAIAARAGAGPEPEPFHPMLRGVLLTGRGRAWMRRDLGGEGEVSTDARRALFWPPTKIAGRFLSPYLARLDDTQTPGAGTQPGGAPVELDVAHELRDA